MLKPPFYLHITPILFVLLFLAGPFFVRAQEGAEASREGGIEASREGSVGASGDEGVGASGDEGVESSGDKGAEALDDADSLVWRFELLTCSPGQEVYELYGHTALRATNNAGKDWVFNYGVFNFQEPNFVWKFVLGKTDYMVQPVPFDIFLIDYIERGSSVTSQLLNLTPEEAAVLWESLYENAKPENRVYRYNYLTQNCTTKVRDMIERAIRGEVMYPERERMTYRDCLHTYTLGHPWAECGDDMLLGANVDTILTDRNSAFLPERLMDCYSQATIYDEQGNFRPMVLGEPVTLLQKRDVPVEKEFPLSPIESVLCFTALCLLVFVLEIAFKRMFWAFDLLVMTAWGLCGVLIAFMFFCSEHPTVDSNWQIWLFNPLPLFFMPHVVWRAIRRRCTPYHLFCMAFLLFFLLFSPWIPQHFAVITLPLAGALLTRPISYYIYYSRMQASPLPKGASGTNRKKKKA